MTLTEIVNECVHHRFCDSCSLYKEYTFNLGPCYKACKKYSVILPSEIALIDIKQDKEDY